MWPGLGSMGKWLRARRDSYSCESVLSGPHGQHCERDQWTALALSWSSAFHLKKSNPSQRLANRRFSLGERGEDRRPQRRLGKLTGSPLKPLSGPAGGLGAIRLDRRGLDRTRSQRPGWVQAPLEYLQRARTNVTVVAHSDRGSFSLEPVHAPTSGHTAGWTSNVLGRVIASIGSRPARVEHGRLGGFRLRRSSGEAPGSGSGPGQTSTICDTADRPCNGKFRAGSP